MAIALIENESISATDARVKEVRPFFEKIVTLAKKGDLYARRKALRLLPNKQAVAELFTTIAPRFAGRNGGYTRIIKVGQRRGDGAHISLIELVVREKKGRKGGKSGEEAKPKKMETIEATETEREDLA